MHKSLIAVTLLAAVFSSPALHAQQDAPANPHPAPGSTFSHITPDVRAILAKQVANNGAGSAAKPANAENLVATASNATFSSGPVYDSITYQYSGGRGSNLTSSLYSYIEFYDPFFQPNPAPNAQAVPTLLYDTLKIYYQINTVGPLFTGRIQTRAYDAANRISGMTERAYDTNAVLIYQNYQNLTYNATSIAGSEQYRDTSATVSGAYMLSGKLATEYNLDQRVKDTTTYYSGLGYYTRYATVYTYNTAGALATATMQSFDPSAGTWTSTYRNTYSYEGLGRLQTKLTESWTSAGWQFYSLDSFGYTGTSPNYTFHQFIDPDSIMLRDIAVLNSLGAWDSVYHYYQPSGGVFQPNGFETLTYNSNNHLTSYTVFSPDGEPTSQSRFYYAPAGGTGVANIRNTAAHFATLSPNPATSTATLNIANPQGRVYIAITNMAGQVLHQQNGPAESITLLNTASLPAGNYQVSIYMGGAVQTLKLVKQ